MPEIGQIEPKTISNAPPTYLLALSWITKESLKYRSPQALASVLDIAPHTDLSPADMMHMAQKIGYDAQMHERAISDIPDAVCPVILFNDQNEALILSVDQNGKRFITHFDAQSVAHQTPANEYQNAIDKHVLYIKAHENLAVPSNSNAKSEKKRNWFWQIVEEHKGIYMRVLLAALFINIFALASPFFVMDVYNRVLPNDAIETGWMLALGMFSVLCFDLLMKVLRGYYIDIAGRRADVLLGKRIYEHIINIKLKHKPGGTGAFASHLRDFEALLEMMTSATMATFVDFPFSFLFIAVLWFIAPQIAFSILVLYVIVLTVCLILQIPVKRAISRSMQASEAKHSLLVETLSSLETVKAVGGIGQLRNRYNAYLGEGAVAGQTSRYWSGLGSHFSGFIQQLTTVVVILNGMYLVHDQQLNVGALIACVIIAGRAIAPVGQIASLVAKWHHARSSYKMLNSIMGLPTDAPEDQEFLHRPNLKGDYEFRNVQFTYPGEAGHGVKNINLHIKSGEKVAILGRVGSGKSTLLKMMMRLYEPDEGVIRLDGTDLRQIDPSDFRHNIGYAAQDTMLFSGSIRENITMGKPAASEDDIVDAAKVSGLYDYVRKHPHGFDAMVGEMGLGLSGGQRQSVVLARALVKRPSILVCDEPSNAMDSLSEKRLINNLAEDIKDKTFILVTHRQTMLPLVDRIILMEQGQILADGPRDQVIKALAEGKFSTKMDV